MASPCFVRVVHRHQRVGLSFQTLTEETRREIATSMLEEERYALSEIAFLTGYSEQSAFNRAFKRWMGVTPATYRKSRLRFPPPATLAAIVKTVASMVSTGARQSF